MLKYSLCLLGAYILYYAVMIVYDLFLKKEKTLQTESVIEFSLSEFAREQSPEANTIGIEDVENLRTPKSFQKSEMDISNEILIEERLDLDEMRRRFESEEDLDAPFGETAEDPYEEQPAEQDQEQESEQELILQQSGQPVVEEAVEAVFEEPVVETAQKQTDSKKSCWRELLNMAETTVKMVENYDGQKVYHSTI